MRRLLPSPPRAHVFPALVAGVAGLVLAQGVPSAALGQSLLAADGLGLPVEPLDARARALGSVGVGLAGAHLLGRDPAAGAQAAISTAAVTFQSSSAALTDGAAARHTRFPAISASYPYAGNVFAVYLDSFLDQEFEIRSEETLMLGGRSVGALHRFTSKGSIGRASLGWSRAVREVFAVGVTVGTYVGVTERRFSLLLDTEDVGIGVEPFESGSRLRASGLVAGAGASWDPGPLVRISGALSWSDALVLSPSTDGRSEEGVYRIPLEVRLGGTANLLTGLSVHAGLSYADWTDAGADLRAGESREAAWSYGGGLEWAGTSLFGRALPLRFGARHRALPFKSAGAAASEFVLTGGFGLNLVDAEDQPLARLELGYERGRRTAGPLEEDMSLLAVTVRVASG